MFFFDGFAPENVKKTTPITLNGFREKEAYFQRQATFEKGEHPIFGETHVNRTSCFCLKNEWYTSKFNQGGIDPAKLGTGNSKSVRCWKIRLLMIIRWCLSVNMLHNVTKTYIYFYWSERCNEHIFFLLIDPYVTHVTTNHFYQFIIFLTLPPCHAREKSPSQPSSWVRRWRPLG